jgi:hypothetical protein
LNPFAVEQIALLKALEHNPAAATQFFGVLTGVVQPTEFFTPQNIFRIIGTRGMAKMLASKLLRAPQRQATTA